MRERIADRVTLVCIDEGVEYIPPCIVYCSIPEK